MMIIDTYPFINGKAVVWVKDSVFTEDNSPVVAKCGLINNIDKFIIPPIYDNIQYIGTDTVAVNIGFKEGKKYQYSGRWGIVDLNNQILVPLKYTDMICWEDGIMFSAEYRRKWGVINIKGEVIIPFKFDWISWPDKNGNIPACPLPVSPPPPQTPSRFGPAGIRPGLSVHRMRTA